MNLLFITEDDCPTSRDRLDAWYRKALPALVKRPHTWSHLRARGDAIKRQWRAYWNQRDALKSNNIIHFPSR